MRLIRLVLWLMRLLLRLIRLALWLIRLLLRLIRLLLWRGSGLPVVAVAAVVIRTPIGLSAPESSVGIGIVTLPTAIAGHLDAFLGRPIRPCCDRVLRSILSWRGQCGRCDHDA